MPSSKRPPHQENGESNWKSSTYKTRTVLACSALVLARTQQVFFNTTVAVTLDTSRKLPPGNLAFNLECGVNCVTCLAFNIGVAVYGGFTLVLEFFFFQGESGVGDGGGG